MSRALLIIVVGCVCPQVQAQERAFSDFRSQTPKGCQLMAFLFPDELGASELFDTSMHFRIWLRYGEPTEIWLDWSSEGIPPSDSPHPREDVIVLSTTRHSILVPNIVQILEKGTNEIDTDNDGKPDTRRDTIGTSFRLGYEDDPPAQHRLPSLLPPPMTMEHFLAQAVALGKRTQDGAELHVGIVDCEEPSHLRVINDLFIVAKAGKYATLLSNRQKESSVLTYCQTRDVVFPAIHFDPFHVRIEAGRQIMAVGKEGYATCSASTSGSEDAWLFHIDRPNSAVVPLVRTPAPPAWVQSTAGYSRWPRSRSLLAALCICGADAWSEEFNLPVDPELVLVGGDWS